MKKTIFLVVVCFTTLIFTNCKKGSSSSGCSGTFIARGDTGFIALPTAFIPNDTVNNKLFRIVKLSADSFASLSLSVYKLSGTLVFQTTHAYQAWDGKDLTGKLCTDYEYSVKLKYTTMGGKSVDTCTFLYMLTVDKVHNCLTNRKADVNSYTFGDGFDAFTGGFPYNTFEYPYCP
jgi:hypothetical protein